MNRMLRHDPTVLTICGVHLPLYDHIHRGPPNLYTLTCRNGVVEAIVDDLRRPNELRPPSITKENLLHTIDAGGKGILIPSLCHGHIHLDKCYLLDKCDELLTGDFPEALGVTARAKAYFLFHQDDLYIRGRKLILASVEAGVTVMRAHVEIDETVDTVCLDTGLRLKKECEAFCDVQIAVFAQDPLFEAGASGPGRNWDLLKSAAATPGVEVVGSAPYVELDTYQAQDNIVLILDLAHEHGLHADFHLDYNLNASAEPLIWFLLRELRERIKTGAWKRDKHVCVGHATRLTLWSDDQWSAYASIVAADALPITLVGLPQSDMYMMGRGAQLPPRCTLDPVRLGTEHGVRAAMAVNNVGNAFTPQGTPDPLALCPLGVALFQAGTRRGCATLVEAVTVNARLAIGKGSVPFCSPNTLTPRVGDAADFVLLHDNDDLQSAACAPSYTRTTIKAGRIVSRRESHSWHLES